MRRFLPLMACGVALGLAACGGDDDSDTGGDTGAATGATAETAPAGGGKASEVVMKDTTFEPASITVSEGTTVTWPNEDPFDHNVTKQSGPGPDFKSGNYGSGKDYKHKFTTAGTYSYTCTLHPGMDGTITVK